MPSLRGAGCAYLILASWALRPPLMMRGPDDVCADAADPGPRMGGDDSMESVNLVTRFAGYLYRPEGASLVNWLPWIPFTEYQVAWLPVNS